MSDGVGIRVLCINVVHLASILHNVTISTNLNF